MGLQITAESREWVCSSKRNWEFVPQFGGQQGKASRTSGLLSRRFSDGTFNDPVLADLSARGGLWNSIRLWRYGAAIPLKAFKASILTIRPDGRNQEGGEGKSKLDRPTFMTLCFCLANSFFNGCNGISAFHWSFKTKVFLAYKTM